MRYILAAIFLWLLSACSPEKLLQKAIDKGAKVTTDTVYQDVRVFVPLVKTDSVFTSLPGDTVRITKDRLEIKYVKLAGEKVYIEGACLPDTLKIEVPVTVTRTISAGYTKFQLIGSSLGAVLFVLLCCYGAYRLLGLTRKSG